MGPANEVLRLSPSLEFHRSAVAVTRIPTCVPEQVERIPDVDGIRRLSWLSCMISLIFSSLEINSNNCWQSARISTFQHKSPRIRGGPHHRGGRRLHLRT